MDEMRPNDNPTSERDMKSSKDKGSAAESLDGLANRIINNKNKTIPSHDSCREEIHARTGRRVVIPFPSS
jgi:hypothetical protein